MRWFGNTYIKHHIQDRDYLKYFIFMLRIMLLLLPLLLLLLHSTSRIPVID